MFEKIRDLTADFEADMDATLKDLERDIDPTPRRVFLISDNFLKIVDIVGKDLEGDEEISVSNMRSLASNMRRNYKNIGFSVELKRLDLFYENVIKKGYLESEKMNQSVFRDNFLKSWLSRIGFISKKKDEKETTTTEEDKE